MFLDVCYALILAAVLPILIVRDLRTSRYRRHVRERLGQLPRWPRTGRPRVWIHAVSLGEMRSLRTVMAALKASRPDVEVLLSTTTETGRNEAQRLYGEVPVIYWPLDFTICVEAALDRMAPDLVVLVELEFWPNFTTACRRRGVAVMLINGRITATSAAGYARLGRLATRMFDTAGRLLVQTAVYAERFAALGVDPGKIRVVPSLKYDTAETAPPAQTAELAAALGLGADDILIVGASTGPGEEAMILTAYRALCGRVRGLRLALVPRHPQRFDEVAALVRADGWPLVRRSQTLGQASPGTVVLNPSATGGHGTLPTALAPVILGDTLGELRCYYALCRVALIGRSWIPAGGSDMIEAAALAKPCVFGPYVSNFEDVAASLMAAGGAIQVGSTAELTVALGQLAADAAQATAMGCRAAQALNQARGGTAQTVDEILAALPNVEQKNS